MIDYKENYKLWCEDKAFDEATKNELLALTDEKEIEDRFYKELEFGTAGLRGIMGAGTNRMNKYTVGRATLALARFVKERFADAEKRGVVIAYDTRNNSSVLARNAADVLTNQGIKVYLFDLPVPTPVLSYSVKHFGCVSGIVMTASHNPPKYNGYKAYDSNGCQLNIEDSEKVIEKVSEIKSFSDVPTVGNDELLTFVGKEVIDLFTNEVLKQSTVSDTSVKKALKIVYTPIHGTGNIPVREIFDKDGFTDVTIVPEQELPNGNFPTVKSPNPEERGALEMGIALAEKIGADIVIGTDPDADRMGCAVKTANGMELLSGNQQGALLVDFVLKTKTVVGKNPIIVKTIVTSEIGARIAEARGAGVIQVLTGFKFIGDVIARLEKEQKEDPENARHFVFGYEESYGYLAGTHARDKDSIVASMLLAEMAAYYKAQGKTLVDAMNDLYDEFGYYLDKQKSFVLAGKDGLEKISQIMVDLRKDSSFVPDVSEIIDYSKGIGDLPKSNVLKFMLKGGSWITIRPSGTEPKIKIYFSLREGSREKANEKFDMLSKLFEEKMGI